MVAITQASPTCTVKALPIPCGLSSLPVVQGAEFFNDHIAELGKRADWKAHSEHDDYTRQSFMVVDNEPTIRVECLVLGDLVPTADDFEGCPYTLTVNLDNDPSGEMPSRSVVETEYSVTALCQEFHVVRHGSTGAPIWYVNATYRLDAKDTV